MTETTSLTKKTKKARESFVADTGRTHAIDATKKRLGKVATEAATVLQGKDQPDYSGHVMSDVVVTIENASKLDIPENKLREIYQSYSGYPGGRKEETLEHLRDRLGISEVIRRTVGGMLPNNKHKKRLLKQLIITD